MDKFGLTQNLHSFGNSHYCEELSVKVLVSQEMIIACRKIRDEMDEILVGTWKCLWN